jgi:hypothetical protein
LPPRRHDRFGRRHRMFLFLNEMRSSAAKPVKAGARHKI